MKVILDLDEETLHNMQGYCAQNGKDMGEMVAKLFNTYIHCAKTGCNNGIERMQTTYTKICEIKKDYLL